MSMGRFYFLPGARIPRNCMAMGQEIPGAFLENNTLSILWIIVTLRSGKT